MPKLLAGSFATYEFTPAEYLQTTNYTELQRQYLQTRFTEVVMQKFQLLLDPEKPQMFIQEEAYYRGKCDMILELLGDANMTLERLVEESRLNMAASLDRKDSNHG